MGTTLDSRLGVLVGTVVAPITGLIVSILFWNSSTAAWQSTPPTVPLGLGIGVTIRGKNTSTQTLVMNVESCQSSTPANRVPTGSPLTLAAGGEGNWTITFTPTVVGAYTMDFYLVGE